jgi:hypothetical protein
MNKRVKLRIALLKALAIVATLGAVAQAGVPYLPQIGPPPMRVATVKSPSVGVLKLIETPVAAPTNSPSSVAATPSDVTNTMNSAGSTASTTPAASAPFVVQTPDQSLGDAFSTSIFTLPTPNLLGISPEMLATYFHPVQTGTNFPGPNSPFRVSFLPPMPPLLQPLVDKSSHAEYIVK